MNYQYMDSEEIDGFRPVREELEVIARHWAQKELDEDLFCYLADFNDNSRQMYILDRQNSVARVIGWDAVNAIRADVCAEERKRIREQFKDTFEEGIDNEFEVQRWYLRREGRRQAKKEVEAAMLNKGT